VACGAAFAETLSRAMPLLGVVLGPLAVLMVMNVQRLTPTEAVQPVLQRGAAVR
jgi:hypothetical protein